MKYTLLLTLLLTLTPLSPRAQGVLPPPPATAAPQRTGGGQLPGMVPPAAQVPPPSPPSVPQPSTQGAVSMDQVLGKQPQQPAQAPAPNLAAAFPLDGYVMPQLMLGIYQKEENLPDDAQARRYVFSILKSISDYCGERSASLAMRSAEYVDPRLGRMMRGDAGASLQMLGDFLQGMSRGVPGVVDYTERNAVLLKEGVEDGRLLVGRHSCHSTEFRRFEANIEGLISQRAGRQPGTADPLRWASMMSPEYRQLNNIPDPTAALRKRELERLSAGALKSCTGLLEDGKTFCPCAIAALQGFDLPPGDWQAMGSSFAAIVTIKADLPAVRDRIAQCYR